MGDGDDALAVDLDDAVSDAHPSALGDAAAEQTADLEEGEELDSFFVEMNWEHNLIRRMAPPPCFH